jgi:mRNA interferase RelE/StbE
VGRSRYSLTLTPEARRCLRRLKPSIAAAIVMFMESDLLTEPLRVGKPLRRELEGMYSARRGVYRVIYEVVDGEIRVLRIDHRADIYRLR